MKWVLAIVAVGVLLVLAVPAYTTWKQARSSTPETSVSGTQIVDGIAKLIGDAARSDGTFTAYYECVKGSACTAAKDTQTNTAHATSYLFRYALLTDSPLTRAKADASMQLLLDKCAKNNIDCDSYFYAFMTYHKATNDAEYLDAIQRAAPSILIRANIPNPNNFMARVVYTDIGNKLVYLHRVTGDKKYTEALGRLADEVLTRGYASFGGEKLYTHGGVDVYENAPLLAARVLLPAYIATKKPEYANALNDIFLKAEPGTNSAYFLTSDRPLAMIEYSINALNELRTLMSDQTQKAHVERQQDLLVDSLVRYRLDTPIRQLFDGSNTFVTGTNAQAQRDTGVSQESQSFKGVNENAYAGLILLDGGYREKEFSLF